MLTKLIINERQTMIRKDFYQIDIGNENVLFLQEEKLLL
jgi:hypothetical protein